MYSLKKIKETYGDFYWECLQGNPDVSYQDVIYDTRKITEGCLFVCLKGLNHNTHHQVSEIVAKGAKVIVIEENITETIPNEITVFKVSSSRKALAYLSIDKFDYPAKKLTVIGITGTKGKTTTTHLLKHSLEYLGYKVGMIGTNGAYIQDNHIPLSNTTPESYVLNELFSQMVKAGCTHVLLEVSSQSVKLDRIAGITFDVGAFLNISEDHIGTGEHENFEEYFYYKAKFFEQCRQIIINIDDELSKCIVEQYKNQPLTTLSLTQSANFSVTQVKYVKDNKFVGTEFLFNNCVYRLGLPGNFNIYNAGIALAVLNVLKIDISNYPNLIAEVVIDGRMENVYSDENFSVIVDFAHNAVSMENLLLTLKSYHPNRLVVVFGSVGSRAKGRRFGMGDVAGKYSDFIILTEDNSKFELIDDILNDIESSVVKHTNSYIKLPIREEAIRYAIKNAQKGDLIVIAGRGHETYLETNGEKRYFKDRDIVLDTLKSLNLV